MHINAGVAHGDIKPDNMVLSDLYKILLIDLGHSDRLDAVVNHSTGTPAYRPAEVGSGAWYKLEKADIFALAVTLLVIITQDLPFGKVKLDTFNRLYKREGT